MFRVRRTAPLSRVKYVIIEREREKNNRKKKKEKTITNAFLSHAITFFRFYKEKVIEKKSFISFFSLNFTAVDNLYIAKFDYIMKLNLFFSC
jgi:hypothetical protein